MKFDYFVNDGTGTVGRALVKSVYDLGFKNIKMTVKGSGNTREVMNERYHLKKLIDETGAELYLANETDLKSFNKGSSFEASGNVDDVFLENKKLLVANNVPNNIKINYEGNLLNLEERQMKKYYSKLNPESEIIFAGGSPKNIGRNVLAIPETSTYNDSNIVKEKFSRALSCNATTIGVLGSCLNNAFNGNWDHVLNWNTTLLRRHADPWETHKPGFRGIRVNTENNPNKAKYIYDVKSVIDNLKNVNMSIISGTGAWREFHFGITTIQGDVDFKAVLESFENYPFSITWQEGGDFSIEKVINILEHRFNIIQAKMKTPIFRIVKDFNGVRIYSLTPQQEIASFPEAVLCYAKAMKISVKESFKIALNKVTDGGIPLKEFNSSFEEVVNK